MPNGYSAGVRMSPEQFPEYLQLVRGTAETWADRMDVLLGLESDYVPGMEGWLEKLHTEAEFHYILGSVHPHIAEYKKKYYNGDPFDYQKLYFTHLAQAAETGLFDSLAHPDLVKNEKPKYWNVEKILPYICASLDRIAATGIAMELNTSGLNKSFPEMNPGPVILKEMAARGIPVVLGADAHRPTRVADKYEEALALLKEAGFSHIRVYKHRKPQSIAIEDALNSLRPIQPATPAPAA